jgi:alpha-amylase
VQLVDLVSCSSVTTDSNGGLSANVADGEPVIYIPADKKGSLCPQTTTTPSGSSSAAGMTIGLPAMSSFALVVAAALSVVA